MKNKQWDCISTITGFAFVGFIIFKILTSSWFWENILIFLGFGILIVTLYFVMKKDNPNSEYEIIQEQLKLIVDRKQKDKENQEINIKAEEFTYELDSSKYQERLLKFKKFLGFNRKNTREDIIEKLGKPTSEEISNKHDFNSLYYDEILCFNYLKKDNSIMSIEINAFRYPNRVEQLLNNLKITDKNSKFIGEDKSEILKYFGKPTKDSGSYLHYEFSKFQIDFFCQHGKKCLIIDVLYF